MRKPLFLFAFANDENQSLKQLKKEESNLRSILFPLHDKEKIEFLSLNGLSLDTIHNTFHKYHNRINLFHYGGHSDDTFLNLTDTDARSEYLSKLIGMQKNLKLVFLNGCANEGQVKDLFANGVKAVIATKAKIEDKAAFLFSDKFYRALVAGKNLSESFESAKAYIMNEYSGVKVISRSAASLEDITISGPEWVLLSSEDSHLTWSINDLQGPKKILNVSKEFYLTEYAINFDKDLVELAFEGLYNYLSQEKKKLWDQYREQEDSNKFNDLQTTVVNSYPSFLSKQLNDIFSSAVRYKGRSRLKELNEAYLTLMKLLTYISLADLWNKIFDNKTSKVKSSFYIQKEYKNELGKFLLRSWEENANYDFGWIISTISRIFKENNVTPFIGELDPIFNSFINGGEIFEAYTFLQRELRTKLAGNDIDDDDVAGLCRDAGKNLGTLLKNCGFLRSYQLVAVKHIEVVKPNLVDEAKFSHIHRALRGKDVDTIREEKIDRSMYTINNSILMNKNFSESDENLYLSPFIIDINNFLIKNESDPIICFFKGLGENKNMHFEKAESFEDKDYIIPKERDELKYKPGIENLRTQMQKILKDLGLEED